MTTAATTIMVTVFGIGWRRGRPMGVSLKPSCLTIYVGLAERGQRRAEGPLVGLDQSRAQFLCRSRLAHTTLGAKRKATERLLDLGIPRTKVTGSKSLSDKSVPDCQL